MKILKRLLLFIAAIIVIALVTALFVKQEMKAEREIVINKPKQQVFDYIKLLKNQDNFSKWNKMDANMKKTYTGTDGTVGFSYAWDSDMSDVGKGSQTIAAIKEGERLDCDLHFIKPFDSKAKIFLSTTAVNDSTTKVTWSFDSRMPYPFNLMRLFSNPEKMIEDDFNTGLANLKAVLEK
jgi:uncharacterized membrane protein